MWRSVLCEAPKAKTYLSPLERSLLAICGNHQIAAMAKEYLPLFPQVNKRIKE
jgi:hypothetical protein